MQSSKKISKGQLDIDDLVTAMHVHSNKSLLDSYDQSNVDIISAINHSGLTTGNPHNVTALEVGVDKIYVDGLGIDALTINGKSSTDFIEITEKGSNNGVAELDSSGKIPVSQLPSYVSDVETYPAFSSFPAIGVDNIIYIAEDTNLTYRWTGSAYVEISPSIALGETSSTAYRGDRGKTAYDHSQLTSGNPHNVTKTDVGLSNVDNTSDANKPISTATQGALDDKQDTLVSGVNIKTIDGQSLLGTGDIPIPPGLSLGETASTAYRGDRGKIAYDLSQEIDTTMDFTLGLIDYFIVDYDGLKINSVQNILNAPTVTMTIAGVPYVLGTPLSLGTKLDVSVSTASVIKLKGTR